MTGAEPDYFFVTEIHGDVSRCFHNIVLLSAEPRLNTVLILNISNTNVHCEPLVSMTLRLFRKTMPLPTREWHWFL